MEPQNLNSKYQLYDPNRVFTFLWNFTNQASIVCFPLNILIFQGPQNSPLCSQHSMSFLAQRSYDTTTGSFSTEVSSSKMTLSYVNLTQN